MKVRAKANGNVIDLPADHPLIGVLYDPVDEVTTKVPPLTTTDLPKKRAK